MSHLPQLQIVHQERLDMIASTPGLSALWAFSRLDGAGRWPSRYDPEVMPYACVAGLRRIGDPKGYGAFDWPYNDDHGRLEFASDGPLGCAVRCNQGHVFIEVPRDDFEGTALALHGRQPFTLIAWVKFVGKRHLIAGIWDEGGWDKYAGRRQVALFAGLFQQKGVIAHVSATGAASYPQSEHPGSQYARLRAIDGQSFEDRQWVAAAMTFDPQTSLVTAYLNGIATPLNLNDHVEADVFGYQTPQPANPIRFKWPLYHPRHFILKFNGYSAKSSGYFEHWLEFDLNARQVTYGAQRNRRTSVGLRHRVRIEFKSTVPERTLAVLQFEAIDTNIPKTVAIHQHLEVASVTRVVARLERFDGEWQTIGSEVTRKIEPGAPFTFGRALGLGQEEPEHGSQLYLDGVAVFNRVLTSSELQTLSFVNAGVS